MTTPYHELSGRGQLRRLRELARRALDQFGLDDARFDLLRWAENLGYRVTSPREAAGAPVGSEHVPGQYMLRLHRPGYHSRVEIASELQWLEGLANAGHAVPRPCVSGEGAWVVESGTSDVPVRYQCTLLRWVQGRVVAGPPKPAHFRRVGGLLARMHAQSSRWVRPACFDRMRWDWDGLFGYGRVFTLEGDAIWDAVPASMRAVWKRVARRVRLVMERFGAGPDVSGLIHADLHLANVLFAGAEARAIDFDECGWGYWIYDLAVALDGWDRQADYRQLRQALRDGYDEQHPLPGAHWRELETFMAARQLFLGLWVIDTAATRPQWRRRAPVLLRATTQALERYTSHRHSSRRRRR